MVKLCPKCGRDLTQDGFCENCKSSFKVFNKITAASKLLYNQGLQLAKVRDLSGSIQLLKRSVKLDKNNIDARNLLGLVYFEIGETVLALQQWVISKNQKPQNNIAENYLKTIQDNQTHLDKLNSAIKKYNQALQQVQQMSDDLAIIQLKKVITLNPNFIKAYALLALCYIKASQKQKAEKALQKILSIDKHNYLARKYLEGITDVNSVSEKIEEYPDEEVHQSTTVQHRAPQTISSFHQVMLVAGGALIGLAVAIFLISPSRIKEKETELTSLKEQVIVKDTEIEDLTQELKSITEKSNVLESANTGLKEDLESAQAIGDESAKILTALKAYNDKNYLNAANSLYLVDSTALIGTDLEVLYNNLKTEVYQKVSTDAYNQGYKYYTYKSKTYYQKAVEQFDIALKFAQNADYVDKAYYYRGVSHYNLENYDLARKDLETVINNYPNSTRVDDANWYLNKF